MSESKNKSEEESLSIDREDRRLYLVQMQEEQRKIQEALDKRLNKAKERLQQTNDFHEKTVWATMFKWTK